MLNKIFPGKNIHQCFQWIYFLLYYTGCLGFTLKNGSELYYNKWSKRYGYVSRIILLVGFISGLWMKFQDDELYQAMVGQLSPVVKFILCFECTISTLTYLAVAFFMDCSRQKHFKFANDLQKLDESLQKDFPGVQWNYHKSARKYNTMTVVLYSYYTIVSSIYTFNVAHSSRGWFSSLIISFTYSCITGAPGFSGFLYVGVMDMLRIRFRLVRQLIRQNFLKPSKKQRTNAADLRRFKLLEYYFKEYSCLILTLNDVFGNICAAGIFHDFALLTNMGFLLCSKAIDANSKWYEFMFITLFVAPRIYKVIMTAIYGYITQKEKRNCSHEFIKMEYYFNKSHVVRDSLQSFLHWRMHNNYYITVGKTVYCSLSLIFLVFNAIANYIMILIQLQVQQNNIVERFLKRFDLMEDVEMINPRKVM